MLPDFHDQPATKAVTVTESVANRQGPVKPTAHLPLGAYQKLSTLTKGFAALLRRDRQLRPFIKRDLGGFRDDLQRQIRAVFPIPRGAKRKAHLDEAYRLMKRGMSSTEILRLQVPNWDELDTYTRYLMNKAVCQAYSRRNRSKKKPLKTDLQSVVRN
jgi:hypothetical protein